ncbi:unnamed protein product, partial [Amoebophrya sp. A25]|eukprot:GSA25T00009987001.1
MPDPVTYRTRFFDLTEQFRFGTDTCGVNKKFRTVLTLTGYHDEIVDEKSTSAADVADAHQPRIMEDGKREATTEQTEGPVKRARGEDFKKTSSKEDVDKRSIRTLSFERQQQLFRQGEDVEIVLDKRQGMVISLVPTKPGYQERIARHHNRLKAKELGLPPEQIPEGDSTYLQSLLPKGLSSENVIFDQQNEQELSMATLEEMSDLPLTLRIPQLGRNLLADYTPDFDLRDEGRQCVKTQFADFFADQDVCMSWGGKRTPTICAQNLPRKIYHVPCLTFAFIKSHEEFKLFQHDLAQIRTSVAPSYMDMAFMDYVAG